MDRWKMYESLVAEYLDYPLPDLVIRDDYTLDLPKPKARNFIYSLIGVRRCGKTFCLFQTMRRLLEQGYDRRRILFFPFDDNRLDLDQADVASQVLEAYYRIVPEAHEGCYLLFDEIQEVPGWDSFVRRVAENEAVTMIITGSSSKLLSTDIPTRLRGRSISREVWPLSFREYCAFHAVPVEGVGGSYSTRAAGRLESSFATYLEVGGFPAVQGLGPTDRTLVLQAYADEIVTKDVLERFESASFRVGRRFARTALRSTGLRFSVNRQIKDLRSLGLSVSDAAAYALLDDLEDAHLVFKLDNYSLTIRDNPKSSCKVYSVDPGLALSVAPASHANLGQRLETAVFVELKRRFGQDRDRVIARYSSKRCPEVDFVVGDILLEEEHQLIQVTVDGGPLGSGVSKKLLAEVDNLEVAMGETGLSEGTLITLDEERDIEVGDGVVHIVPAWKWFLG
jgi:predicted AAA+ superfamily ATPase